MNAGSKQIPQILVIDLVVVLHSRRLDERAQQTWAAIDSSALEIDIMASYWCSKSLLLSILPLTLYKFKSTLNKLF